jgi:hypothetical protein
LDLISGVDSLCRFHVSTVQVYITSGYDIICHLYHKSHKGENAYETHISIQYGLTAGAEKVRENGRFCFYLIALINQIDEEVKSENDVF